MTTQQFTFCRICEPNCPMVATIDDHGRVEGFAPDPDHPIGGTACHKGLSFLDVHNDPDRLDHPLRRMNAKTDLEARFATTDWGSAVADIAARLAAIRDKHGPHAIATYLGNPPAFNSTLGAALMSWVHALGTYSTFCAATQDCTNKFMGAWAIYGSHEANPIPDIYNTDYVLCLGANPRVSKWTLISTPADPDVLKNVKKRGGKILFVNPRQIESSTHETGETLRIFPGTDVYLLAAILNGIDRHRGLAGPLVDRHGKNLEKLRAFVGYYSPERVAPIVGIDAAMIEKVADDLLRAKSAAVYISVGVNQSRQGLLAYWLAEMINFVTGNLGMRGGTHKPNGLFSHFPTQKLTCVDTSIGGLNMFDPPWFPAAMPSTIMADLINAGDIKALLVFGGNPLLTIGGEGELRSAFEKLDLMVSFDIFRNVTSETADFILPATDWMEREDINAFPSGMQTFPYVQFTDRLVEPHGERRSEAEAILDIMGAMGLHAPQPAEGQSVSEMFIEEMLAQRELSISQLLRSPHGTVRFADLPPESFFERCLQHPDRKVDCYPDVFQEKGLIERCNKIFEELSNREPDSLRLIMLRTPHMHNSWHANVDTLRQGKHATNALHMCEADASARGLHHGDMVRISNENGEIVTLLEIDDDLRAGVVALSHGYGHAGARGLRTAAAKPGVNFNRLAPSGLTAFEPVSNMAWLSALPVTVERCPAPKVDVMRPA